MIRFHHAILAGATATALLTAGAADAATITFTNMTVQWFAPVGEPAARALVTTGGSGTADSTVAWGQPVGNGQSSFRFVTAGDIATDVAIAFTLGDFTHSNNPVYFGLTGVSLRLIADVVVDGASVGSRAFIYAFSIDETPNTPPCPYGGIGGQCSDLVAIGAGPATQTFDVAGRAYTLAFSAFDVGGNKTGSFVSAEGGSNTAQLRALVSVAGVPEPATWGLMIVGFGMVAGAMRRRLGRGVPAAA
ncbi:hypothetical protein ASG29_15910 [Sphingomonas sp. Leaf412]|uniref:THxN family PEP-CTERM protein n=1 Tax=Sphingomonas sp. Leaf412 TaxID=1736370 RepID=UPI0006F6BAEE|nr:THxN family PEP-CTERM protein [Sphingomonas sp. Leaf412]KQT30991.1 hypothetical protein ASG29_15910 [Sphingomonas sp. Leaf412]